MSICRSGVRILNEGTKFSDLQPPAAPAESHGYRGVFFQNSVKMSTELHIHQQDSFKVKTSKRQIIVTNEEVCFPFALSAVLCFMAKDQEYLSVKTSVINTFWVNRASPFEGEKMWNGKWMVSDISFIFMAYSNLTQQVTAIIISYWHCWRKISGRNSGIEDESAQVSKTACGLFFWVWVHLLFPLNTSQGITRRISLIWNI